MDDSSRNRPIDTRTFNPSADCPQYGSDRRIPDEFIRKNDDRTILFTQTISRYRTSKKYRIHLSIQKKFE